MLGRAKHSGRQFEEVCAEEGERSSIEGLLDRVRKRREAGRNDKDPLMGNPWRGAGEVWRGAGRRVEGPGECQRLCGGEEAVLGCPSFVDVLRWRAGDYFFSRAEMGDHNHGVWAKMIVSDGVCGGRTRRLKELEFAFDEPVE